MGHDSRDEHYLQSTCTSTLTKMDTFGTGTSCPSYRDVRLIESQIEGGKIGRDQH